jgi:tetratricopeptide (TPR) repeat protein
MKCHYKHLIKEIIFFCVVFCFELFPQEAAINFSDHIKTLMIDGKNKDAIYELNSILQKDTANVDALYYLGLNYEAVSDYLKAAEALKLAAKYRPGNAKLLASLGSDEFYSGLIIEADTVLYKAFLLDSTDSHIQILLGKVYMNEKKWAEACIVYSRLISTDTTNSFFYQQLAQCYSNLGNASEAIKNDILANKLNPRNQEIILDLTYFYFLQEQYHEALNILDNGLMYYHRSAKLYKWKGDIYLNTSDYYNALYSYQGAINCGDSSAIILKSMGECLYWIKKYPSAINFLEHSIELNPKDPAAYFYLGASYKAQNKLDKAMENYKTADTLLQNSFLASVDAQIGSIYQIQQKYKEALEYYREAFRANPEDRSNMFYLAAMNEKLKNNRSALNYYKMFVSRPENEDKSLLDFAGKRIIELNKNESKK